MSNFKLSMLLAFLALSAVLPVSTILRASAGPSYNLSIEGLVSSPLNLTYTEVENLPQVSEIALLQCVYAPSGAPFNWTGVPLFYLLNMAHVQAGAKEVVFRAADGFSSSLTIDKAMHPTTLLALKVNGTTLLETQPLIDSLPAGYPYKLVAPCKLGYKWVGWIDEIEVVGYDYKGTYESQGFSDDADTQNCTALPETEPPYATIDTSLPTDCKVTIFSNSDIEDVSFNQTTRHISLMTIADNYDRFVYVIIPKKLLYLDFQISSNGTLTGDNIVESQTNSFICFQMDQGTNYIEIKGVRPADVTGPHGSSDGKIDLFDIAYVARRLMSTPENPLWNSRTDLNGDNVIDMKDLALVAKDFGIIS